MPDHFVFLKTLQPELYRHCRQAEQNVKTKPNIAAFEMRKALERFMTWICEFHHIEVIGAWKTPTLDERIRKTAEIGFFDGEIAKHLHKVKRIGNEAVHPGNAPSDKGDPITVKRAVDQLLSFHKVILSYVMAHHRVLAEPINEDNIPIMDCYPEYLLPLDDSEACEKKFMCTRYNEFTHLQVYCVVRQFRRSKVKQDSGFQLRDWMTLERRWTMDPLPQNIVRYRPIEIESGNEFFYTCYELGGERSQTLDQVNLKQLTIHEKLDILLGIVNGIQELHDNEEPIIHRYLRPSSIYLTKLKNGRWLPKICNFEYSKVDNPNIETMIQKVLERKDPYKAPEIALNAGDTYWPSVDLYSFGVLVLYMFGLPVQGIKKPAELQRSKLSREFVQLTANLLSPVPGQRPGIIQVKEQFEKEVLLHV